jgi:ligand-binding sensor domain-containing protein
VDEYSSVKTVNCLYKDEEGRLWIGTNDSGVSIMIDETIINVVSDKNYKPSAIVDQCLVEIPMLIREDGTVCYENLHMICKEDFENVN